MFDRAVNKVTLITTVVQAQGWKNLVHVRVMYHTCTKHRLKGAKYRAQKFLWTNNSVRKTSWNQILNVIYLQETDLAKSLANLITFYRSTRLSIAWTFEHSAYRKTIILNSVYFTLLEDIYVERIFRGWGLSAKFLCLAPIFCFLCESFFADIVKIQFS